VRPSLPLLAIALSACMPPTLKEGLTMAERGDFEAAARYFMQQLDGDVEDAIAAKGLDRVARDSFEVKLDIAREAEADGRYADSLAAFDDAEGWLGTLREYEAVTWDPGDALSVEREEVRDRLAMKHYVDGKDEVEAGKFAEGIASFTEALSVRENFQDTAERLRDAYYDWGRAEATAGHYREAADAFAEAVSRGKGHEAVAWGSAVSAALGRYYLSTGHCRHAALEFRRVDRGAVRDLELNEVATRAEACARVELVVEPFDEVAGEAVRGTSLGAVVSDQVVHEISERGSEFVKLLDREAARAFTAVGAEPRPGHLYVVRGKVSQYRMERAEPVATVKSVVAHKREICPPPDGPYYDLEEQWCDDPYTLLWDESRESVKWRIAGNVRIADPISAEQLLSKPLELSETATRTARGELRREDGGPGPLPLSADRTEGKYAEPQTLIDALAEESTPLPNDGELALASAHAFAGEVAVQVLAAVDRPPLPPVPGRLAVTPPVTSADQLEFQSPAPQEAP
jgi:hypothetical protein